MASFNLCVFILCLISSFVHCCYSHDNNNNNIYKKKKPRNILDLSQAERQKFVNSFDLFLTDCDGVIWQVTSKIKGAGESINAIKNAGKKVGFITNNSARPEDNYLMKFKEADIDIDFKDLFHPIRSTLAYLKKIKFEGLIYCISTALFKDALRNAGYSVIDGPNEFIKESYTDLARHVFTRDPVRAVIMDTDFNISGPKLIKAQLYLRHPDCILITGATDNLLPVQPNVSIIGPGFYGKLIADVTKKEPIVLGKPGKGLCDIIMDKYNINNPKRVLMVGDMLEQDVGFGKVCGFQTLAVLTGGCQIEDFKKPENADLLPDYYANSLADLKEIFENL